MERYLNIISFNIPYPPNYGGIIDVFYKIVALRALGVKVILHCFEYERPRAAELEKLCERVHYYKRRTGLFRNITPLPYNVYSRKDPRLLENLLSNDYPILFEGLHTCYYIGHPSLRRRMKLVRECNIEHDYYRDLAQAGKGFVRNLFYRVEALRFRLYEPVLRHADIALAVSATDADSLRARYPRLRVEFMPCFHANDRVSVRQGRSDFILYHGKLSVPENERAALFLIERVFSRLSVPCVIAGMAPSRRLLKAAASYPNIRIEANPDKERMDYLIREAQIHLLVTFQGTGLKLKLLNSLFAGRHVVANRTMLKGSGADILCHIADTPDEMLRACEELMDQPVDDKTIELREAVLSHYFSNEEQARRLVWMIYG